MLLRRARAFALLAALAVPVVTGAVVVAPAAPAGAVTSPASVTIGVDHAGPAGTNWQYTDFFPRSRLAVHQGELVDFAWAQVADGFHNVALLPAGVAASAAWATWPIALPDTDAGSGASTEPSPLVLNNVANFGNQPAPCTAAAPCSYDGHHDVIAGASPTDGQTHFVVRIDASPGTRVNYVCLIHPGMHGSFTVVAPTANATTPATAAARAATQYRLDTAGARLAERRADHAVVTRRGDGHRLILANAGTSAPHVEVLEMLPRALHIHPGDVVEWRYRRGAEIHTVTFTGGNDGFAEPLVPECENGPPPSDPNAPPCGGDVSQLELHVVPQPQGVTGITGTTAAGSSGLLDADPRSPLPDHFGFSFPDASPDIAYMCHIHDHMTGVVKVDTA